ncbi:MAG TPA: LLM class flavin-dependent oxidoreductase [Thermomicrobiales bacterium]|jgi:alkanesulfonate monooxygenase SsuD/methylene tetrahydromethanopterin reductase-like flavin-dependent oxidoreductase (luciferase family)|nr:LLM class flavin-dependent oxidoreductase [Thermomicrobiales bacterium]
MSLNNQPIKFGLVTGQHQLTWDQVRDQWLLGEELGFDQMYLFDHFTGLYGDEAGPCLEASTLLAALARETERVDIGVLVYGNTHRHPAILAKEIVTIDHVSNGRAILGIGAGWNENEHRWYGWELPAPGPRIRMFDEAMTVITGLFNANERFSFDGEFYTIDNAPFSPKPVGDMPILIGAKGKKNLRVVAKYADIWDGGGRTLAERQPRVEELKRACDEVGRDFNEIVQSQGYGASGLLDPNLEEVIREQSAAGVSQFLFDMPITKEEQDQVRKIAKDILPKFREG